MRLAMVLGIVGVLAMAAPAFAIPTYVGGTLTYPNGDLDPVVDPLLNAADVPVGQQSGIPLAVYNALGPQVVHFNDLPTASGAPGPVATIVAQYDPGDATKTVTINNFHNATLGFGGNSPFGLIHTSEVLGDAGGGLFDDVFNGGPSNGTRPWVQLSPIAPNPGLVWFGCDISFPSRIRPPRGWGSSVLMSSPKPAPAAEAASLTAWTTSGSPSPKRARRPPSPSPPGWACSAWHC